MTTPPINVHHFLNKRFERANLRIVYLSLERDLFQAYGPTAARHLTDNHRRQLSRLAHDLGWKHAANIAKIATVRSLRRWYSRLIRCAVVAAQRGGKPPTHPETEAEVVRLAEENSWGNDAWGRLRIVGEMAKLGVKIARNTVRAILRRHGIPPAPRRGQRRDDWAVIIHDPVTTAAIDFAHAVIAEGGILRNLSILIGIHHGTREVEIASVGENPTERSTLQSARNLTMADVGFFVKHRVETVIMDRDPLFTAGLRKLLDDAGCHPHRKPPHCPWLNGYAERFIRTLKESLLQKAIFTSESALRWGLQEFVRHYHEERPHQGLAMGSSFHPLRRHRKKGAWCGIRELADF